MSVVTTIVATVPHNSAVILAEMNGALERMDGGFTTGTFSVVDPCGPCVGGTKCAEVDIFIGAFNHLDVMLFLEQLPRMSWVEFPDDSYYYQGQERAVVIITSSDGEMTEVWQQPLNG